MIPIYAAIVLCVCLYFIGKYQGIAIGRKEIIALDRRLSPREERWSINIDAQVTDACRERCAQMIAEAHAAAEWRLPA